MVQMNNVRKVYESSNTVALDGVSLTINDGEFVFLVGPSGSGKTTIMKLITGEVRPTSGQIIVNDFDMGTIKRRKLPKVRRTLGVIFQDYRLIEDMNVYDNVAFAMRVVGATNSFIRLPFVVEGLVLGILGGGLAFLAEWGLYNLVTGKLVASVTESFITFVPFHSVALEVFIVYMAVGILVGAFGGVNAIRNYLKV